MKRRMLLLVALLLALSCSAASAQDLDALLAQMQCADAGARTAAVQAVAEMGAPALPPLFALLDGDDPNAALAARRAIRRITYAASAPGADGAAAAQALVGVAASSASTSARGYALRMVSFVGGDEVVPSLARLLDDEAVREMARWTLVRIPGEAASRALAAALPAADGEFKAGLIAALGVRGDAASAPLVRAALDDSNDTVRIAAIEALGSIPDPASEPALGRLLSDSGREGEAARAAYLRLAGTLLAAGNADLAARMCRERYLAADSAQEKCAALSGLAKASGDAAVPTLLEALGGPQHAVAGAAAAALVQVPGEAATKMIAAAIPDAAPPMRLRLVAILGRRGDPAALPVLASAARPSRSADLREAAVRAMGEIGDSAAVPALASAAGAGGESVRAAAVAALSRLPGDDATPAVLAALNSASPGARPALVRVLGYRRDTRAAPAVVAAIRDGDAAVRLAGIQAAGEMPAPAATPALLDVLRAGGDDEQVAAEAALGRMRTPEARSTMAAAMDGAPAPMRAALLRALGRRADPDLLPLYAAAATDSDEAVSLAGLQALGILRDEKAAPTFVQMAQSDSTPVRAMAVHGYLLLSTACFDRDREHALAMSRLALTLPAPDDDRRAALGVIGHFRDADSLDLVTPLLQDEALGRSAVPAAMAIAAGIGETDKEPAIALLRRLLGITDNRELLNSIAAQLRQLGEDVDQARDAGFIVHWWVLGPVGTVEQLMESDLVPTDAPIDLTRKIEADGAAFEWHPVRIHDVFGMVDLEETVAHKADCGAYGYAEVTSDVERDVLVKIGSDDDVVGWLNGEQIHVNWGGRGYAPDQAIVPARLHAGVNFVLLKVLNRGGNWGLGLRFTDPDGQPLILKQRQP